MRMKLQDIKIGTKLAWGFGLLLVVMAMLIALAVVNLGAIYGDLDRIVRINNTRQSLAAAMTEIEREDAIAVRNAFLQRERVKEMIQRMDGNNKKHAEMFNQVEEMTAPDDSAGHALLSRVRETRNSSHALNMKTMEMMAQNMFDEAFRFYEKESRAAMRQSISAGDELIRHQTERSSTRYEASTGHYRRTKTSMLVLGGCALLLGIIMSVVLTRNIVRPLREGVAVANRLAGGDLSVRVEAERKDEMGQLLLAMKNMVVKLNRVIADVIAVSGSVFSGSRQLAAGAEQMAQGTTEQASSTQEASSTVEQMNATIRQNSDNAQQTEKISRMSAADADRSGKAVTDTVVAMKDIAGKIAVVDELARQTNLLALNAAIEAARAGEHGKGFAVVASEVRKLAERSQEAAAEICRLSSASMQIAENAGALLEKLVPDIGRTAELVQEISAASKEQAGGADQINAAIQQLNQVVQNNAGASEELAATAEELASQADQLTQTVAFFTVEREPMKAAQAPAPARSGSASKTTKTVSGGRSAEKMEWHAA